MGDPCDIYKTGAVDIKHNLLIINDFALATNIDKESLRPTQLIDNTYNLQLTVYQKLTIQ